MGSFSPTWISSRRPADFRVFRAFGMLREFHQEVERAEDLEVTPRSAADHAAHGARRRWPGRESGGSDPVPLDK